MSDVFRNIEPPPPSPPGECVPPAIGAGGDHSSVLFICKYFVILSIYLKGEKYVFAYLWKF
jgi:hypothetical protein